MPKSARIPLLAPYQLGCSLAHRLQEHCLLCHVNLSQPNIYRQSNRTFSHSWADWVGLSDTGVLCLSCQKQLPKLPAVFGVSKESHIDIQAAAPYRYPVKQLIQAFKFHEDMSKLPILRYLLEQLPKPKACNASNAVILPMPTTAKRLSKRGFDPVTILSAHLSQIWQIPRWQGIERIDDTISQRHLNRQERFGNLDNAFAITMPLPAHIRHVLLFDDVATTGASLYSLAHTLLLSYHSLQISGYCIAHGN